MENEQNLELEQEIIEKPEEKPEKPEKLTPEQELGIKKRQLTRLAKELGVELPKKEETPKPAEKTSFDDTEHLFLDVKQVPEEDRAWLFEEVKTTGKSLRQAFGLGFIQVGLKDRAQMRASEQALPEGNNRTGALQKDSVEYWIAKINAGQASILDVPNPEIRKKVHEARRKRGAESRFSSSPVV